MATRAEIVREARSWVGTRYRHQGCQKGIGTDCGGLIYGVGFSLGLLPDVEHLPDPSRFRGYARGDARVAAACDDILHPIPTDLMQPGDVVLIAFQSVPQHVAILGNYVYGGLSLIHAYIQVRKVVESRLDEAFSSRIVAAYSYKGVET